MRHKRIQLSGVILLRLGLTALYAQTSVNTAGGNTSESSGSVGYSIGQVVNTTSTGSNGSVQVGIQLPYEISVITSVEQTSINLDFKAYPNPTADNLFLKMELTDQTPCTYYSLMDNGGKVLINNKITDVTTVIPAHIFTSGVYYLKITRNDKLVGTFKIIKK